MELKSWLYERRSDRSIWRLVKTAGSATSYEVLEKTSKDKVEAVFRMDGIRTLIKGIAASLTCAGVESVRRELDEGGLLTSCCLFFPPYNTLEC